MHTLSDEIEIKQIEHYLFELLVPEELYQKLKVAADSAGFGSVDSFVSESLLPVHSVDT